MGTGRRLKGVTRASEHADRVHATATRHEVSRVTGTTIGLVERVAEDIAENEIKPIDWLVPVS